MKKAKAAKKGGKFAVEYRPPCDTFLLNKNTSSENFFYVTDPKYSVQLLARDHEDDGWCNAVGCRGEYWTVALSGEQIDNGYKVSFVSEVLDTSYDMVCPFGGLTPAVTEVSCVEGGGSPSASCSVVEGPYCEFSSSTVTGCSDGYAVTVECTTDDDDLLESMFKKAKSCETLGTPLNSDNKFMMVYESSDADDVTFVDGINYELEPLAASGDDDGWCSQTACLGEHWAAYVEGVDTDDGTKYVISVADGASFSSHNFMCPYADQTPVLLNAECYQGDDGSVSSASIDAFGPTIEDVNISHTCDVLTITLECQQNPNIFF